MGRILGIVAAAAGAALLVAGSAQAKSGAGCDRACLTGVLNDYIVGVARHDPKAAPLAPNYRETQNAVEVKAGDGVWTSLVGLGDVQRRYLDPVSGQAVYFGLADEAGGKQALLSLRVKMTGRKVAQAEWIIARQAEALFNPSGLAAEPPPVGTGKATRAQLQAAANSYFEGLQAKDGKITSIYAAMHYLPAQAPETTGWPDDPAK